MLEHEVDISQVLDVICPSTDLAADDTDAGHEDNIQAGPQRRKKTTQTMYLSGRLSVSSALLDW